jgi:large subunit ribosomal protein L18e
MGIYISSNIGKKRFNRSSIQSKNIYYNMIFKVYRFLTRRTNSKFNFSILKRLQMSRTNQSTISLTRLIRLSLNNLTKTIVVVGKVLNDDRVINIPKITICALRITNSTKKRIIAAGGTIIRFDQLAVCNPMGKNTILIRGARCVKKRL